MKNRTHLIFRKGSFVLTCLIVMITTLISAQHSTALRKPNIAAYASVNGLNMYYEIYGEGSMPLVIIHGGGSTIESNFGNILPLLSGKIIAVELQAHGHTSDRNAPESFVQDADDVASLLKFLKIEKTNFLGFSNGGSTTMQIAIRHPEIVNKIIVASGAYRRDGFISGFFDGMKNATLKDVPVSLQNAYLKVKPDEKGLQTMFEKDRDRMIGFKDWNDDELKSIKVKTLFMVSDHDVITPEHTLKMSRLVTDSQLIILPGSHGGFVGESSSYSEKEKYLLKAGVELIEGFLRE